MARPRDHRSCSRPEPLGLGAAAGRRAAIAAGLTRALAFTWMRIEGSGLIRVRVHVIAAMLPGMDATAAATRRPQSAVFDAFAYRLMRRGPPPRVLKWVVLALMSVTGAVLVYFAAFALMGAV
jgi:hypothetical protein